MEKKLLRLGGIAAEDCPLVGAKAANLSALAASGFSVPEGFVITTLTYDKFLEKLDLQPPIESLLASVDFEDEASLESCAREVRDLILGADVEPWVRSDFGEDPLMQGTDWELPRAHHHTVLQP